MDTQKFELLKFQIEQIIQIHNTYLSIVLAVTSIYFAIMGTCLKFTYDSQKPNQQEKAHSFNLALFAFTLAISIAFFLGIISQIWEAVRRQNRIDELAKEIGMQPIGLYALPIILVLILLVVLFLIIGSCIYYFNILNKKS